MGVDSLASVCGSDIDRSSSLPHRLVLPAEYDATALPSLDDLISARPRVPEVLISGDINIGTGLSLPWIRFLRDATAVGMKIEWSARAEAGVDLSQFTHLCAPKDIRKGSFGGFLAQWRAAANQTFYWRRGPNFVSIRDTRLGREANRWIIDDGDTLHEFLRVQTPVQREATSKVALDCLVEEGLVVESMGLVLALPYRIQRWPIPYTSI